MSTSFHIFGVRSLLGSPEGRASRLGAEHNPAAGNSCPRRRAAHRGARAPRERRDAARHPALDVSPPEARKAARGRGWVAAKNRFRLQITRPLAAKKSAETAGPVFQEFPMSGARA